MAELKELEERVAELPNLYSHQAEAKAGKPVKKRTKDHNTMVQLAEDGLIP